jgi:hypothetical protein
VAEKDSWDKFDILFKTLVLGLIPIAIGVAANGVADSLKRGQLIQSLVDNLSQRDTKRDIALIALNDAISAKKKCRVLGLFNCSVDVSNDPVSQIASVLIGDSLDEALEKQQSPKELAVAKYILTESARGDIRFYEVKFGQRFRELKANAQSVAISNADARPTQDDIAKQANISQTIAALDTKKSKSNESVSLPGVRLVYIQYGSDQNLAKRVQTLLVSNKVAAPGTEQVQGVTRSSIRYSGAADKPAAESLRLLLMKEININTDDMIDLSKSGYRVPSGQFEVWIK